MNSQKKKSENYGELFQPANEIVYTHDLSGNFTSINHTGEIISGYSREEVCRMNIAELVPAEIAEQVREGVVRDMTKRVGAVYEVDLIAKNGTRVPLEVSTTVVMSEGRPVEIQGIALPSVIRGDARFGETLRAVEANLFGGR